MKEINRADFKHFSDYRHAKSEEFEIASDNLCVNETVDTEEDRAIINEILTLCNTAEHEYRGGYNALNLIDKVLALYGGSIEDLAKRGLKNKDLGLWVEEVAYDKAHPDDYWE